MADDTLRFDPDEELEEWITPTPLSDPVLAAIFQNAEESGLAMGSLLNATLEDSGDMPVGEVVKVTPQSVHSETSSRGFRIDVEAWTASGEIAIVEVQLKKFAAMIERVLLYAEQALASGAKRGDKLEQVTSAMARVIIVNILGKALRETGGYHQVVELLYREPPYQRATDKLNVHNLELDKYRRADDRKPTTALRCWLTAICISQDEKKPLKEVVKMIPELQEYYDNDPGFAQFVQRHEVVAAMPDVRKAYRRWEYEVMLNKLHEERIEAEIKEQQAKGEAKAWADGESEGKIEGRDERDMEIALKMFASLKKGKSLSDVMDTLKDFDIPDHIIEAARGRQNLM